jgi:hypothetical protein
MSPNIWPRPEPFPRKIYFSKQNWSFCDPNWTFEGFLEIYQLVIDFKFSVVIFICKPINKSGQNPDLMPQLKKPVLSPGHDTVSIRNLVLIKAQPKILSFEFEMQMFCIDSKLQIF